MKIWAHRGCSQNYPENTLLAFSKAAELNELTGIELDIQLTKDGELVVIHDETVDRTTEGKGFVRDYSLAELKKLHIYAGDYEPQKIPTMVEVLDLLEERMKSEANPLMLNIELKTSVHPYFGIERRIVELIRERDLESQVVYSSFYAMSIERLKNLGVGSELAILDTKVSDCLFKAKGGCGAKALHPFWKGMDIPKFDIEKALGENVSVRAWMSGHLYPEKPTGGRLDFEALEKQGITDVIINEPEVYIN